MSVFSLIIDVVEVVSLPAVYIIGQMNARGSAMKKAREEIARRESQCAGYVHAGGRDRKGRFKTPEMRTDCRAERANDCDDGRCSYHCGQMCKCVERRRAAWLGKGAM